jgi:hypothetical protein
MFEGTEPWAIVAIAIAAGLFGVLAIQIVMTSQEAEAKGCKTSVAFNASKGRCFHP